MKSIAYSFNFVDKYKDDEIILRDLLKTRSFIKSNKLKFRNEEYIELFKNKKRYILYIKKNDISEAELVMILDYYLVELENLEELESNYSVFLVFKVKSINDVLEKYLNYGLLWQRENHRMIIPIVISESENKLIMCTGYNYTGLENSDNLPAIKQIKKILNDFMACYYKEKNKNINNYTGIVHIGIDENIRQPYPSKRVISKYNYSNLYLYLEIFFLLLLLVFSIVFTIIKPFNIIIFLPFLGIFIPISISGVIERKRFLSNVQLIVLEYSSFIPNLEKYIKKKSENSVVIIKEKREFIEYKDVVIVFNEETITNFDVLCKNNCLVLKYLPLENILVIMNREKNQKQIKLLEKFLQKIKKIDIL